MANIVTKAAQITVLAPQADNTYTSELGDVTVGATVGVFEKGAVGEIMRITPNNLTDKLGFPISKDYPEYRESLYHVKEALDGGAGCSYVNVVRIVPDDAKFPTLSVDAATGAVTQDAELYGTDIEAGTGVLMVIYPKDGDPSLDRSVGIKTVHEEWGDWEPDTLYAVGDVIIDYYHWHTRHNWYWECITEHTSAASWSYSTERPNWKWVYKPVNIIKQFELAFYNKDSNGEEYEEESFVVSIDPEAKDALGRSQYLPHVLEKQSEKFACAFNEEITNWTATKTALVSLAQTDFSGGTNGTLDETHLTEAIWTAGWDAFKSPTVKSDLMFMAGCHNPDVIKHAAEIAEIKRPFLFSGDVECDQDSDSALNEQLEAGISSRYLSMYYCPLSANDPFKNSERSIWGASGAAVAAKAKAIGQHAKGKMPGVHAPPAGETVGRLSRTGIKQLYPKDDTDREAFVNARLNPVIAGDDFSASYGGGTTVGAVIDDCLTNHFEDNYLRFQWVNAIEAYIARRFLVMARAAKFKPGGLATTILDRGMKRILEECDTAGYFKDPQEPEYDGAARYLFEVRLEEIDLFGVYYSFCPTGVARRIFGQPILIR